MNSFFNRLASGFERNGSGRVSITVVWGCSVLFFVLSALHWLRLVSWEHSISILGLSRSGLFEHWWLFEFVTSPFVHGNLTHFAFNMLSLWTLGPPIESVLGRNRYVLFSLLCAVAAQVGFLCLSGSPYQVGFGYSGVIFGILVAQGVYFPERTIVIFALFPLKMRNAALLLGGIELYLTISGGSGKLSHAAHLFGALAGLAYIWILRFRTKMGRFSDTARPPLAKPRVRPRIGRNDIPREM